MDILKRNIAPLTEEAWNEIDQRAIEVLHSHLSARKVVHVEGPKGWDYTVVPEGRLALVDEEDDVKTGVYKSTALVEARVSFELERWEMDNLVRGAKDVELEALENAVHKLAVFEEEAIYNGYDKGQIKGLKASSEQETLNFGEDAKTILEMIAKGRIMLQDAFAEKPYNLVVGDEAWKRINRESNNYPLVKQVEELIGGKVIYSKVVKGAFLLPDDHEDLEMTIGQDYSIGYEAHTDEKVKLFITESFAFRVLDPALIINFNI
jgi:uncharacterized linocin/CFP29 family protein